jgi:hypothetical protein
MAVKTATLGGILILDLLIGLLEALLHLRPMFIERHDEAIQQLWLLSLLSKR